MFVAGVYVPPQTSTAALPEGSWQEAEGVLYDLADDTAALPESASFMWVGDFNIRLGTSLEEDALFDVAATHSPELAVPRVHAPGPARPLSAMDHTPARWGPCS